VAAFAERLVLLPHHYQVNQIAADAIEAGLLPPSVPAGGASSTQQQQQPQPPPQQQPPPPPQPQRPPLPSRRDEGLPRNVALLALTGNPAKLGPETMDVAANALLRQGGTSRGGRGAASALLLVSYPMAPLPGGGGGGGGGDAAAAAQRARLRAELGARGLGLARRVVVVAHAPTREHLRRSGLVDAHLDSHPYNAHSTAADCTFAGVPHLTLLGEQMPSRLAAALLRAVGVPHTAHATLRALEESAARLLAPAAAAAVADVVVRS